MSNDPRLDMFYGAQKALKEQAEAAAAKIPKRKPGGEALSIEDGIKATYAALGGVE